MTATQIELLCAGCDQVKPYDDFHFDRTKGRPKPRCKQCINAWRRRYRKDRSQPCGNDNGRRCAKCMVFKPWDSYAPGKSLQGKRSQCTTCDERYDLVKSLRPTGMSVDQYNDLIDISGGCNVCGRPPVGGKRLAVDHCHGTGLTRGLLCVRCNTALGLVDDDPARLQALIDYLLDPPLWRDI